MQLLVLPICLYLQSSAVKVVEKEVRRKDIGMCHLKKLLCRICGQTKSLPDHSEKCTKENPCFEISQILCGKDYCQFYLYLTNYAPFKGLPTQPRFLFGENCGSSRCYIKDCCLNPISFVCKSHIRHDVIVYHQNHRYPDSGN